LTVSPKEPRRRRALLLGCSEFSDPALPSLRSPATDVRRLAAVLGDPNGSNYDVTIKINIAAYEAQLAIDQFLDAANTRDLHLIYFSGHGIQDARGGLYFAFANTNAKLPSSTAVSADWLRERMNNSRSRSTVILLDCCFSGLFLRGMRSRTTSDANVASLVGDLPEGSGIAVLTASGETEFSLEDADAEPGLGVRPSYFTEAVVTGIRTGAADADGDGRITVDELYDYVYARVKEGPSPQRPRKMGYGEGHVIVALTARRPTAPTPDRPRAALIATRPGVLSESPPPLRPDTSPVQASTAAASTPVVEVKGILGTVSFDGERVTVTKAGFGPKMKGSIQLPVDQITAVAVKPATRLFHGYIQFVVRNYPVAPVVRVGFAAGRPHREDPFSMSFARKQNGAIVDFQKQVEAALPFPAPIAPKVRGASTAVTAEHAASSRAATPASLPGRGMTAGNELAASALSATSQIPQSPVAARTAEPGSALPAGTVDPYVVAQTQAEASLAERRQGRADGAACAEHIPLHAWGSLVASGYDVVRWIEPWCSYWKSIGSGNAAPDLHLVKWLPTMEHNFGRSPTPDGSGALPSTNYVEGLTTGLRDTWRAAVRDQLLPPTPQAFESWLKTPVEPPYTPPGLLTIADLRASAKQASKDRTRRLALRITLWTSTSLFALFELGAIVISVAGGWRPNNTSSQIIGNLMCSVPLAGLVTALILDVRRTNRRPRRSAQGLNQ
jgi:hypothetical protein